MNWQKLPVSWKVSNCITQDIRTPPGEWAPLSQFTKRDDYIDPALLAVRSDATLDFEREIYWVQGRNLVSGRPKWIPHELFDADCTKQSANPIFCQSSNGLSSGNTVEESILHGLCEVAERDQISFWLATAQYTKQLANTLVCLDTVDNPICLSLINRCQRQASTFLSGMLPPTSTCPYLPAQ